METLLSQLSHFFHSFCWSRVETTCRIQSASVLLFSLGMIALGIAGLILARARLRQFRLKGLPVRILSLVLLLGVAGAFIPRLGILVEIGVALVVLIIGLILAEKPRAVAPLPAEMLTTQSSPDEPAYRLHLRLMKDGSGILIVNAATVLHLNATAAEYAYHMLKGSTPEATGRQIARRYRISRENATKDYLEFRDRIQALIHTPDLDPVTFLDFERVAPHTAGLTAPLRLDCALTYRLPEGTSPLLAPTRRVERELTTQEWQGIMEKAWAEGIPHLTFTGGEPTLREDLPALIAHAEKLGQVTGLLTDGLKLADREYLQTLLQAGLDHLLFVLAPENPESWKALETVMPEDLFTTVHLTVDAGNAAGAEATLARLAGLGVKSLSLGASETSLHENLHALHERAASLGITLHWDLPVPFSAENPVAHETIEDEVPRGAGKTWLYVEPDGDVLPEQGEADRVLGNLLRDPWEKIYP